MISDTLDPSGMGMFSKIGRITTEKFYILRKKNEILSAEKKTVKIPLFTVSNKIKEALKEFTQQKKDHFRNSKKKDQNFTENFDFKAVEEAKKKLAIQPFQRLTNRQQREKNYHDVFKPPALGTYNPHPIQVSEKIWRSYSQEKAGRVKPRNSHGRSKKLTYQDMLRATPRKRPRTVTGKSRRRSKMSRGLNFAKSSTLLKGDRHRRDSESSFSSQSGISLMFKKQRRAKLKPKKNYFGSFPNRPVSGFVSMKKQTNRKSLNTKEDFDIEGKQFKYLEIPSCSSRHRKKKRIFNWEIMKSRPPIFGDVNKDHPDYRPNFEIRKRRLNTHILNFETVTPRKPPGKLSSTANESYYDYDRYKNSNVSQVLRKVRLVNFEKDLPKELDPTSHYPSFMQKSRPMTAKSLKKSNLLKSKSKENSIFKKRPFSSFSRVKM